jgi:hypothetical protein
VELEPGAVRADSRGLLQPGAYAAHPSVSFGVSLNRAWALTPAAGGGVAPQDFMVVRVEIQFGTTK